MIKRKLLSHINIIGLFAISVACILLLLASSHNKFSTPNYAGDVYNKHSLEHGRMANQLYGREQQNSFSNSNYNNNNNKNYYQARSNNNGDKWQQKLSRQQQQQHPQSQYLQSNSQPDLHTSNSGMEVLESKPRKKVYEVVAEERARIREEINGYPFEGGHDINSLTPETNGTPFRSIILTTWRSGSTFLGDILNAIPGNFYHYEPLLNFDIVQVRDEPDATKAISNIKNLLHCDYANMSEYLTYGQDHTYLFKHNTRLWQVCQEHPHLCWRFLHNYCRLFPFQSMKVVRLRLGIAARLFEDRNLNVRIILLIRDPRGTMQSRKHREWCPGRPDCDHAPTVCRDLVSDYQAAQILSKQYPRHFKVVRYEDLSLDPYEGTKEILKFYGLAFEEHVVDFLDSHTKLDYGGVSSTYRDSKTAPFNWMKRLTFDEVNDIQRGCEKAMKLWGYREVTQNETLFDPTFSPLLPYTLD